MGAVEKRLREEITKLRVDINEGDHTYAFAARVGGGIDIALKSRFEIRAIQVDWFRTQFANAKNDRQNNLLVAAGITYHWSLAK